MIQKNPAVDLQARYRKTFEAALIAALALAIVAFKFFPDVAPPKPLDQGIATPPMIAEVPLTSQPKKPPPPPRPPIVIEAPADEAPVDVPFRSDLVPDAAVPPPPAPEDINDKIFIPLQHTPEPIGGFAVIQKNLVYPDMARRIGLEGTVIVLAYIDEKGVVDHAEVIQGIGAGCDEAAVSALMKTRFRPATQRDKPVKVKAEFRIGFRLYR